MTNGYNVEGYRSPKTLSLVVISLFAIQLVCYGLYLLFSFVQIAMPDWTFEGSEGLTIPYLLIGLTSFVETLARLATIVTFLIWLYRVYSNLSPLKARDLEFTPGWAVGWWFIPFANLIKPYQAVTEAWRESDPNYDPELGFLTSTIENSWHFPIWWGSFLIGNIFTRVSEMAVGEDSVSDSYPYLLILAVIFSGVSATLAIWIVRDTTQRQEARAARLGESTGPLQPPPPPIFSSAS